MDGAESNGSRSSDVAGDEVRSAASEVAADPRERAASEASSSVQPRRRSAASEARVACVYLVLATDDDGWPSRLPFHRVQFASLAPWGPSDDEERWCHVIGRAPCISDTGYFETRPNVLFAKILPPLPLSPADQTSIAKRGKGSWLGKFRPPNSCVEPRS